MAAMAVALSFNSLAFATDPSAAPEMDPLPKEVSSKGLSLGMTFTDLKEKRPAIQLNKEESFRKIYMEKDFSESIDWVVYYVTDDDKGTERVYEFILVLRPGNDPMKFAQAAVGEPNFLYKKNEGDEGSKEWRFDGSDTGLRSEVALWTFKNSLVIAYAMPGSEWEEGFVEGAE